jgi:hypothetical protein
MSGSNHISESAFEGKRVVSTNVMSRRNLFRAGVLTGTAFLAATASASASDSDASDNEAVIRTWYAAWEKKDRDGSRFDAMLADDFTFSSPDGNDHISKPAFKRNCWETQIAFVKGFDLKYHRLRNRRLEEIVCYFGGTSTYPSAVSAQKSQPVPMSRG